MGLREQLRVLRANATIVIACLTAAVTVALVLSLVLPKTWDSENKLIVGNAIGANTPDYNAQLLAQQLSQSYALMATTGPVLQTVIDELGLDVTIDELKDQVFAEAPRDLNVVEITASWTDPETAAAIANAVSDELVRVTALAGGNAEIQAFVEEQLATTMRDINETRTKIDELSEVTDPTPAETTELATLRSQLIQLNATYASLLGYISGTAANKLTVIEPAIPADEPASPRLLVNVIAAIVVGLLCGLGLAFIRDQLDDSLRTPEQVSAALGLATLASISKMPELAGREPIYRLAMTVFPRSSAAESFRMLRTNLEFASVDHRLQLISVTSALPSEGKTLVAANLAVAFAQAGHRTILVDADLRNPEVHRLFGLSNAVGLTSALRAADQELEAVLQETVEANLKLLASGPQPPNPAELLGSNAMVRVLDRLRNQADIVVFDTPPLQAVTDAAVLGASVDGTLLVTHTGRTGRGASQGAVDALGRVGAHVVGAVLNLTKGEWIGAYGYYGSSGSTGETTINLETDRIDTDGPNRDHAQRKIRTELTSREPPANV